MENTELIKASPAAWEVSLPYAAGTTTAFKPIERQVIIIPLTSILSVKKPPLGSNAHTPMYKSGKTHIRIAEITYKRHCFISDKTSALAIIIPVNIIAIGDIQSPATFTTEVMTVGSCKPVKPIIKPKSVAMNMGLQTVFNLDFQSRFSSVFSIKSAGTAQR